jgi:quinol monooxygenase YgiN
MIIIIGSARASADTFNELRALSVEHVHRSRLEPGCLSHDVHTDVENELRLVFVETWRDRDAVAAHFAVPTSIEFAKAARRRAAEPPVVRIYDATAAEI